MFRFTIRDVLWLMVAVAMGLGWWVSYRTASAENRRLLLITSEQSSNLQFAERCMLDVIEEEDGFRMLQKWFQRRREIELEKRGY